MRSVNKKDADILATAVIETASKLGLDIKFHADEDLGRYKKGRVLTVGELRSLPDNSVVWVTFKEDGEHRYRINGAQYIHRCLPPKFHVSEGCDLWGFNDGSSFGSEIELKQDLPDSAPAYDGDWGPFYVHEAVALKEKK